MFLNENDVYEIRLNQHWDFVDKFIVIEASESHTGLKKGFKFDKKRFEKYSEKLIYKTFDSFEEEMSKYPDLIDAHMIHNYLFVQNTRYLDWVRDNFQTSYLVKILNDLGASDSDLVYFGCTDELIKEEAFHLAKKIFEDKELVLKLTQPPGLPTHSLEYWHTHQLDYFPNGISRPIVSFHLQWYVYKLNLRSFITCPLSTLYEVGTCRKIFPSTARHLGLGTHVMGTEDALAGWHFTFMDDGNNKMVLEKQRNWAHSKDTTGTYGKWEHLTDQSAMVRGLLTKHAAEKVGIETLPKYVGANLDKFKNITLSGNEVYV